MAIGKVDVKVEALDHIAELFNDIIDFDPARGMERMSHYNVAVKAVAAGAKMYYDILEAAVPSNTGTLKSAVYRYFNKAPGSYDPANRGGKVTYNVGVNVRKAPHFWLVGHGHNVYDGQWIATFDKALPNKYGVVSRYRTFPLRTKKYRKNKDRGIQYHVSGRPYLEPTWEANKSRVVDKVISTYRSILSEYIDGKFTLGSSVKIV